MQRTYEGKFVLDDHRDILELKFSVELEAENVILVEDIFNAFSNKKIDIAFSNKKIDITIEEKGK